MSPINSPDLTPLQHRFISSCTESSTRTLPAMIEQSPPRLPWFPYDAFLSFTHPFHLVATRLFWRILMFFLPETLTERERPQQCVGVCRGFPPGQWPVWVCTGPIPLAFPQASGPFGLSPASSYRHSPRPVARLGLHHPPFWAPSRPNSPVWVHLTRRICSGSVRPPAYLLWCRPEKKP